MPASVGDSKLAIDWANQKAEVKFLGLESLLVDICGDATSFEYIVFCHILRQRLIICLKKLLNCWLAQSIIMS